MATNNPQQAEIARLRSELRSAQNKGRAGWACYFDAVRAAAGDRVVLCDQIRSLTDQLEASQSQNLSSHDSFERPLTQLRALLKSTKQSLECPVCLDELRPAITNKAHENYMVIFGCGHSICNRCAHTLRQSANTDCPSCRRDVKTSLDHLMAIDPDADENEVTPDDVGLTEALPSDAVPSRYPGKCKACFEEVARDAPIVPSSQAKRVYVHLKCRDVPLKDCYHCGKRFAGEDRVVGKYTDRILACNDCGVIHSWIGAKRAPPSAPNKPKAKKRARTK